MPTLNLSKPDPGLRPTHLRHVKYTNLYMYISISDCILPDDAGQPGHLLEDEAPVRLLGGGLGPAGLGEGGHAPALVGRPQPAPPQLGHALQHPRLLPRTLVRLLLLLLHLLDPTPLPRPFVSRVPSLSLYANGNLQLLPKRSLEDILHSGHSDWWIVLTQICWDVPPFNSGSW